MLGYIKGTVLQKRGSHLIVVTHDIGYRISIPARMASDVAIGGVCELHLYHYVRENSSELYGFFSVSELSLFEKLISVSGVGPKTALGILSVSDVDNLKDAIARGDAALLRGVSGVGTKTAERIIVELKGAITLSGEEILAPSSEDADIIDALVHLGYSASMARQAVTRIPRDTVSVQDRMKAALQSLAS
ncbi:Holliday junction branch migration protein RuvA [Candidatus Uhrbacteria bacterium]|nr:Holliday junction branch migration protein RuvA [Candidatus Uhrbacteria bacterium]